MPTAKLTNTIIEAAITGFEAQKKVIDDQIAKLRAMLAGTPEPSTAPVPAKQKRSKWSATARKRMREIQLARWAKIKGKSKAASAKTPATTAKKKGGLTAAGRKALSEAMKQRWAAKKAAGGQSAPAAKKKAPREKVA